MMHRRVPDGAGADRIAALVASGARLHAAVGDGVAVWGDANGAYEPGDAPHVASLGLDLVEQPFAAGDLVDHAAFVRTHPEVDVSLDESVASTHDARAALAELRRTTEPVALVHGAVAVVVHAVAALGGRPHGAQTRQNTVSALTDPDGALPPLARVTAVSAARAHEVVHDHQEVLKVVVAAVEEVFP